MTDHLKTIENAVRSIRHEASMKTLDDRNKQTYIIWKSVDDRNVKDVSDVVGLFYGTHEEADDLIAKLNDADPSVREGFGGRKLYGYYRTEPTLITEANLKEFLQF